MRKGVVGECCMSPPFPKGQETCNEGWFIGLVLGYCDQLLLPGWRGEGGEPLMWVEGNCSRHLFRECKHVNAVLMLLERIQIKLWWTVYVENVYDVSPVLPHNQ